MAINEPMNAVVTKAGYEYIGHFHKGNIRLCLSGNGWGITLYPKNEFNLYELFNCFGIDCEDGVWMDELVGRYCRVILDENNKVYEIRHILKDSIRWENDSN